jgi:enoyl-CoA hydratase
MVNPPTNALVDPRFADKEELRSFFADGDLTSVILQGEGRHFCSGADPQNFAVSFRDPGTLQKSLTTAKELLEIIAFAPVPVVAVISGSCLGGGLEIALACHFRYAVKTAMFGFPECNHSLMPGLGGTLFPQHLISRGHLIDLVLSSRMIGAEEAREIGLVDFVGSAKAMVHEALRFLDSLTAGLPPQLIRSVMRSIHNGRRLPLEEALIEETRLFCELAQDLVKVDAVRNPIS